MIKNVKLVSKITTATTNKNLFNNYSSIFQNYSDHLNFYFKYLAKIQRLENIIFFPNPIIIPLPNLATLLLALCQPALPTIRSDKITPRAILAPAAFFVRLLARGRDQLIAIFNLTLGRSRGMRTRRPG